MWVWVCVTLRACWLGHYLHVIEPPSFTPSTSFISTVSLPVHSLFLYLFGRLFASLLPTKFPNPRAARFVLHCAFPLCSKAGSLQVRFMSASQPQARILLVRSQCCTWFPKYVKHSWCDSNANWLEMPMPNSAHIETGLYDHSWTHQLSLKRRHGTLHETLWRSSSHQALLVPWEAVRPQVDWVHRPGCGRWITQWGCRDVGAAGDASLSSRIWGLKKNNFLCIAVSIFPFVAMVLTLGWGCCWSSCRSRRSSQESQKSNLEPVNAFDTIHRWIGTALPKCCWPWWGPSPVMSPAKIVWSQKMLWQFPSLESKQVAKEKCWH